MTYTPDIIQKANSEINRRREASKIELAKRVEDVKLNLPEIYSVYEEILQTKTKLAEAVFSKSGDLKSTIEEIKSKNLANQEKLKKLLVSFGKPIDYLTEEHTCNICKDTGAIEGIRCSCVTELLDKLMVEKLNEQCKIKLHDFSEFSLDYYPNSVEYNNQLINCKESMRRNLNYLIDYANNFTKNSNGIFMIGKTGLGKTFLSSCVAKSLISKGHSVAFDSVQNYLRDIEKEHFGKANGDTLETLLNADLLILDDLGSEFSSSFNDSVIYNLINSRNNAGMPTIISTNLSLDELTSRYDDRITSRLMGAHYPMRFIGEDIRQQKRRNGEF